MSDNAEILALARDMAMATKVEGSSNWKAIKGGHWDNGNYVKQFIPAAEAELIRRSAENTDTE